MRGLWQVRASPVPSNVTILEQMDGLHGGLAPQPGVSLGMPAIPTTSSPLDAAGGYRSVPHLSCHTKALAAPMVVDISAEP